MVSPARGALLGRCKTRYEQMLQEAVDAANSLRREVRTSFPTILPV